MTSVLFMRRGSSGVDVIVNGTQYGPFQPTSRIVAFGQEGNDLISAINMLLPTYLFGGEGNDILLGGRSANVLVGGPGIDVLTGQGDRDLLIGGDGADGLAGIGGDDILIAGRNGIRQRRCRPLRDHGGMDFKPELRGPHRQSAWRRKRTRPSPTARTAMFSFVPARQLPEPCSTMPLSTY